MMEKPKRIYFLDNLRAVAVLLVVVMHGSLTYMVGAPTWWYVVDSQNSLLFTILLVLIDVPVMQILFFIAGYFAMPSLAKRGPDGFVKSKFIRVGAPWLFGALVLAPPTTYIAYYSRQVPMSLVEFWTSEFWANAYQQSVYWYLGVLFAIFLGLAAVYSFSRALQGEEQSIKIPTWKLFLFFWALMSLGMFLINQFFPMATWYTNLYILVFQPLRVPLYIGYFVLGIYANLKGWFSQEGYQPRIPVWLSLWMVSGLLVVVNVLFILPGSPAPSNLLKLISAVLFNAYCLSTLMLGTAFFQRRVDSSTTFWRNVSGNAYGIYYAHPLILYPLTLVFLPVSLPVLLKGILVILLGILLSWAFSNYLLTRIPLIRQVFG